MCARMGLGWRIRHFSCEDKFKIVYIFLYKKMWYIIHYVWMLSVIWWTGQHLHILKCNETKKKEKYTSLIRNRNFCYLLDIERKWKSYPISNVTSHLAWAGTFFQVLAKLTNLNALRSPNPCAGWYMKPRLFWSQTSSRRASVSHVQARRCWISRQVRLGLKEPKEMQPINSFHI